MRRKIIVIILLGAIPIVVFYYNIDPVKTAYVPHCLWKQLTGWSCPTCGIQRFSHAFLHGHFYVAFKYNYILLLLFPYIMLLGIERLVLRGNIQRCWQSVLENKVTFISVCLLIVAWGVIRNILEI